VANVQKAHKKSTLVEKGEKNKTAKEEGVVLE
jgi:hypothetical protein